MFAAEQHIGGKGTSGQSSAPHGAGNAAMAAKGNGPGDLQLLDFVPVAIGWVTGSDDDATIDYAGEFDNFRSRSHLGLAGGGVDANHGSAPHPGGRIAR